jgi:hypothetical protein
MKKTISLLLLSFLAASCYEEVVIPVGGDEPVGVMNAQLSTLDSTHFVYLSVSRKNRVRALPGADVRVFVNGAQALTAQELPPHYEGEWETAYVFETEIRPGDEVRIEARQGSLSLSAAVTAPQAVTISSVDTSTVRMTYMGETDTYLQAKTVFRDIPDASFYRVYGRVVDDFVYLDEDGIPIPDFSGTAETGLWMETGFDPVISEGAGKTGGADLAAILSDGNSYSCFSDNPFADGECTIRPLISPYSFPLGPYGTYIPASMQDDPDWEMLASLQRKVHRRATVQIRSLDFSQYHYLKALENLDTFGTEMSFLVEPTTLPSNVEGGLGFVGLETVTEYIFYENTSVFPPADFPYYY